MYKLVLFNESEVQNSKQKNARLHGRITVGTFRPLGRYSYGSRKCLSGALKTGRQRSLVEVMKTHSLCGRFSGLLSETEIAETFAESHILTELNGEPLFTPNAFLRSK